MGKHLVPDLQNNAVHMDDTVRFGCTSRFFERDQDPVLLASKKVYKVDAKDVLYWGRKYCCIGTTHDSILGCLD